MMPDENSRQPICCMNIAFTEIIT